MEKQTKKSYNPFKMWGAWVGFSLPIITYFFVLLLNIIDITTQKSIPFVTIVGKISLFFIWGLNPIGYWEISQCDGPGCGYITLLSSPIVYFLIGWLIHSLIRRFSK